MIQIAIPHPNDIIMHWDEVEPFIQLAINESNEELTIDVVKAKVESGQLIIAVVYHDGELVAAISFGILEFDSGMRAINIQCAGGTHMELWYEEVTALAENLAKKHNCQKVYVIGRAGWAKQMKGLGYKTVHTVISKEVA